MTHEYFFSDKKWWASKWNNSPSRISFFNFNKTWWKSWSKCCMFGCRRWNLFDIHVRSTWSWLIMSMTHGPWVIILLELTFRTSGIKFKHGLIENAMFRRVFEMAIFDWLRGIPNQHHFENPCKWCTMDWSRSNWIICLWKRLRHYWKNRVVRMAMRFLL